MANIGGFTKRFSAAAGLVLDFALPATCAGCGVEGDALCAQCEPALDARLALAPGIPVGLPGEVPAPLVQVEWCASFSGVTRRALHALKYGGERRIAGPAGRAVARRWARAGAGGDVMVPVPASADRIRDRGYDQAALIAREASAHLGLPVRDDLLERVRHTIAQFDLDRTSRGRNVRGAFRVRPGARLPPGVGPSGTPWIVLVDDVLTTGSTLSACATTLLDAGACAVSAITVARKR
ncbi:MAG: ComF family protein [Chloroflexi bacterium]|nr:ComF family protein [Chloroflexota bacterium]